MAQTSNYGLGKPDANTTVAEEIERLIATWDQVDLILKTLADAIATKAAANHNQAIGTITGLTEALAGKMAASKTFAVADLTDVSGSVEAALGYVLAKTALGFSFQSAASLLGNHQHGVADIIGLTAAIDAKIAALVASSPATLDTLAELATALGNDPNFATTIASQIAAKADAARVINTGDGLLGGGSLAANRTLSVDLATLADVTAGTLKKMVDAATLKSALAAFNNIGAWVRFYWNGTSVVILASMNVSSVVRNAAGRFTVNFAAALADGNYALAGAVSQYPGDINLVPSFFTDAGTTYRPGSYATASSCQVAFQSRGGGFNDPYSEASLIFVR